MSDLSLQLQPASGQLPVSSYFDTALYQREMQAIFARGPRYVGHALSVPNVGDYYALPQEKEGRALVRNTSGIELISNVCRHRQAVMLKGRGALDQGGGNIVCPIHRWTYSATPTATALPGTATPTSIRISDCRSSTVRASGSMPSSCRRSTPASRPAAMISGRPSERPTAFWSA